MWLERICITVCSLACKLQKEGVQLFEFVLGARMANSIIACYFQVLTTLKTFHLQ